VALLAREAVIFFQSAVGRRIEWKSTAHIEWTPSVCPGSDAPIDGARSHPTASPSHRSCRWPGFAVVVSATERLNPVAKENCLTDGLDGLMMAS
jgi:hypothetical protein